MKLKFVLVGVLALSLGVSAAVAAPPPGKGKPQTTPPAGKGKPLTTGSTCKPKVTVVLKGTFTSLSGNTLTMAVTRGNRWARAWVTLGTAQVTVDPSTTKVRIDHRNGAKALADLVSGDWLLVQARACKAELQAATLPTLTAVRLVAHKPKT
jgi:hypothetical protein